MPFELEQTTLDSGVVVLTLSGTMTMGNQLQRFEWTVEEATKNNQNRIVLDMSQIAYLDSSGIGVLVGCTGKVKSAGGQLRLAGVTDRVMSILKMTGVDRVLNLDLGKDAAIAALAHGSGAD
jgi:anti-sigma B factor antagonist